MSENLKKLYVGNISFNVTPEKLREAFEQWGQIEELNIIKDRETGRSKGFGFVTYSTAEEANQAVEKMNGVELDERPLKVNKAEDRPPRRNTY